MPEENWKGHDERRQSVRVAGQGILEAVVIDQHGQPVQLLQGTQVRNVSSGGVAFTTSSKVDVGHHIKMKYIENEPSRESGSPFQVEAVEVVALPNQSYMIHCRLIEGTIPAKLVYSW